jgi:hypothetical protein
VLAAKPTRPRWEIDQRYLRRLLEELGQSRESLSPNGARARLSSDTERCQALTTWLHTYNHHGDNRLGGQPRYPCG